MIFVWWAIAVYLFLGLWVVAVGVDWSSGIRFHSKRFPFPVVSRLNIILATTLQVLLIVLLWPLYSRVLPFYEPPDPEANDESGDSRNP